MSESNLSADVKAAIAKNLPAQVAEELKAYLDAAKKAEERAAMLERANKDLLADVSDQRTTISKQELQLLTQERLTERENIITERERTLAVEIAELKQQAAEKRADELRSVLEVVFRSPVYRKHTSKNFCGSVYDSAYSPSSENVTETTEQE